MVSYITVLVGHDGAGVELVREAQDLLSSLSWQIHHLVYPSVSVMFFSLHRCQNPWQKQQAVSEGSSCGH